MQSLAAMNNLKRTLATRAFTLPKDASALILLLAVGLILFALQYVNYEAVPGRNEAHPLGWWGWADQGHYLEASRNFLSGELKPEAQFYPPLYPALGAIFLPLSEMHGYLLLTLTLYTTYLWAFFKTFKAYVGRWATVLAAVLGLFLYDITLLQWAIPWTSSLAAALQMIALLLFHRFLNRRRDINWSARQRVRNAVLCGGVVGLLTLVRPIDFLVFLPLLLVYALLVLRDHIHDRTNAGRGALPTLAGGVSFAALPAAAYLCFNAWLFGNPFGGYFSAVERAGGLAIMETIDRAYSHLLDAKAFYAEPSADWLTQLPWLVFFLCFLPAALLNTPVFLRVVGAIVVLNFGLVYSYADAVPTGQFRFYNIHYFKWLFPVLPIFLLYPLRRLFSRNRQNKGNVGLSLMSGLVLALCLLSLGPAYRLHEPASIIADSKNTIEVSFRDSVSVDFVDIRSLSAVIGQFDPSVQLVEINGHTWIEPVKEVRLTPRRDGIRFLFTDTTVLRSARFTVSGLGDVSQLKHLSAIAGEVHLGLKAPWANEPLLPDFPLVEVPRDVFLEASDDENIKPFLGKGWSVSEEWGRWMDGPVATLHFKLSPQDPAPARLILEGQAFLPDIESKVDFDVLINELHVKTVAILDPGLQHFEIQWPEEAWDPEGIAVTIRLVPKSTLSPRDAGVSQDDRQLSFGLIRLKVMQ